MTGLGGVDRWARRLLLRAESNALGVSATMDDDTPMPSRLDFAAQCHFDPDDWQRLVLESEEPKLILNCCRQAGKSTTTAVTALYEGLHVALSLVLLLSPSQRQSSELFRKVIQLYHALETPPAQIVDESALRVEFTNGSRIIALPGSEATTRGYSAATLVVIDEAARVPDGLIAAVRPTLATTNGRLIALSTPAGRRGWFAETWSRGEGWQRTEVKATDCPRISPAFLEDERRELGEFVYVQEYECQFLDAETSVFSSALIERALSDVSVTPLFGAGFTFSIGRTA